jgi:hypothetical protein
LSERWYAQTALDDLLGVGGEAVYDNRLYRGLSRIARAGTDNIIANGKVFPSASVWFSSYSPLSKQKQRTKSGQILIDSEPCEPVPKKFEEW